MNEEWFSNDAESILKCKVNNFASINGIVMTEPKIKTCIKGENILELEVKVGRKSGAYDVIPVAISERTLRDDQLNIGDKVNFEGEFRSYNKVVDEKSHLCLNLFAKRYNKLENDANLSHNKVDLVGYICKTPVYRETPLGREICDILIAVNRRNYDKSDYVPVIVWGRNAKFAQDLRIGDKILLEGRMQSRIYNKDLDGEIVTKTAYEVSGNSIWLLEKNQEAHDEGKLVDKTYTDTKA